MYVRIYSYFPDIQECLSILHLWVETCYSILAWLNEIYLQGEYIQTRPSRSLYQFLPSEVLHWLKIHLIRKFWFFVENTFEHVCTRPNRENYTATFSAAHGFSVFLHMHDIGSKWWSVYMIEMIGLYMVPLSILLRIYTVMIFKYLVPLDKHHLEFNPDTL